MKKSGSGRQASDHGNVRRTFPASRGSASKDPPECSEPPVGRHENVRRTFSSSPAKILVVEDSPLNLELVRDILVAEGYEVLEAADGAAGIEIARLEQPDLILMDLQLPEMDGLEAARRLRADARTASVPIIAVTARTMKGDDERAREAGCTGFVTKPIDVRQFTAVVAESLKGHGSSGGRARPR